MNKIIANLKLVGLGSLFTASENTGLRYFSRTFCVVAVFLGGSLLPTGSVQAQEIAGRVCSMSGYLSFEGPLSKQDGEHEVFGEATISACVDENGPVEGAEAQVLFSGEGTANCMLQDFTLMQLVEWNYGQLDFVTLRPPAGGRAPLGSYKGMVDFGESEGSKVITVLFNEEPLQTLSCLLGVDPIGTFTFRGVQIFTDLDKSL